MKPQVLRIGLVGLLAVGIGLAWWCRDQWTAEAIGVWVEGLGVWEPLVFVGVYCLAPALFFPGVVLTLAGGALFGPMLGALLSLAGATVGATVAFLIARHVAADWVEHRLGRRLQEIKAGVEREDWRFVAFVRLVPVFPFNLLNYALGLTRLSVRTFAVTSLLTMAPGALAYAYLGYAGREVVSGGPALVRKGFLALTLLAAVALLPVLIRHWRRPGRLTLRQFHALRSQDALPLVLDVRSPEEFIGELGHIGGALLIPLPELDHRLAALTPHRQRTIVTVGKGEGRSGRAAEWLRAHGFPSVCVLTGGMESWQRAGLPVSHEHDSAAEPLGGGRRAPQGCPGAIASERAILEG